MYLQRSRVGWSHVGWSRIRWSCVGQSHIGQSRIGWSHIGLRGCLLDVGMLATNPMPTFQTFCRIVWLWGKAFTITTPISSPTKLMCHKGSRKDKSDCKRPKVLIYVNSV